MATRKRKKEQDELVVASEENKKARIDEPPLDEPPLDEPPLDELPRIEPPLNEQPVEGKKNPIASLPAELRNKIYELVLLSPKPIVIQPRGCYNKALGKDEPFWETEEPGLLQTCNMYRREALPMYYGNNDIVVKVEALQLTWSLKWIQAIVDRLGPQRPFRSFNFLIRPLQAVKDIEIFRRIAHFFFQNHTVRLNKATYVSPEIVWKTTSYGFEREVLRQPENGIFRFEAAYMTGQNNMADLTRAHMLQQLVQLAIRGREKGLEVDDVFQDWMNRMRAKYRRGSATSKPRKS